MPTSLFTLLERVMLRDESLQFTISRGGDHAHSVMTVGNAGATRDE